MLYFQALGVHYDNLNTLVVNLNKLKFFLELPQIDVRHVVTNC